jgi:HPt (histidine-containing phosphotransfer) domain-containing protein
MSIIYTHIDPLVLLATLDQDPEAFCELSHTFLSIAPQMFARLNAAILAQDCRAITERAHALKGTAALIGATRFTRRLAALESQVLEGQTDELPSRFADLMHAFDAILLEVKASITQVIKENK